MIRLALLASVLGTAIACVPGGCDTSARSSVTVSVYDSSGELYAPDDVTYSVDGEPEVACEDLGDGTEFVCGWEEVGTFLITVYDGGNTWTEQVQVDQDPEGCHVRSEFVDITVG